MRRLFPTNLAVLLLLTLAMTVRADRIDDYIRKQMQRQHIPGLSLAVVKDGKVIKAKGYGLANVETNTPAKPETVYQIQSMTKQFTATGIMMLVEEGKIRLDEPVGAYLEGTPESWKSITVRHLLTHTSGIKDYINEPTQSLRLDVTDAEVFQATIPRPLNFPVGERFLYSNTNYHLLGMMIHKITGKPYGEFLRERVFEPLGMKDTRILSLTEIIPLRASGYRWDGRLLRNGDYIAGSVLGYAGGGIRSTVLDLAKWDAALYGERLLKEASLEQMWTPAKLNNGSRSDYGFGWRLGSLRGRRFVSHGGGHLTGFTSVITRFPEDRLTVIVFTNQMGAASPASIAEGVARLYIPALAIPTRTVAKVDPALLDAYTGRYELANNAMLTVTRERKRLLTALPGQEAEEVLPESENTFFFPERDILMTFLKDNKGEVSGLVWKQDGQDRTVPRIGPLAHALKPGSDPDTALNGKIVTALKALAQGGKVVEDAAELTPGARMDFADGPVSGLTGIQSFVYVADQDITGRGIERHGAAVVRIRYFKLVREGEIGYVLVHLTADGLITDVDVVED
jgi:CubicO group peptidase (beta-lactamase class C family)